MDKNVLGHLPDFKVADPPNVLSEVSSEEPTDRQKAEVMPLSSPEHVQAATPLLKSTSIYGRVFCATLVLCGVVMIGWALLSPMSGSGVMAIGVPLIGIALIVVGVVATLLLERSMLSTTYRLAALPEEDPKLLPSTVTINQVDVDTGGGAYIDGDVTTENFVGRDQYESI